MSSSSEMKNTLENYRIPLEEIKWATNSFDKKYQIEAVGFGSVYKGKLSERWGNRTAAIKRGDPYSYQGKREFVSEIQIVSTFQHQNIIPLIGYCDEGNEMIIVYEYAINGSLADHLRDINRRSSLTWVQRLRICLGAAQGLNHLHSGLSLTVIHRDVNSANILLDENMEAKICDFGLSRYGWGYTDPLYMETGILTKQSDVYSLGVVLFEMLSGMLAYARDDKQRTLINLVRVSKVGGLDEITDPLISDQMNGQSLKTFQRVAYRCINFERSERPTMDEIIREIEKALHIQIVGHVIPLEKIILATNNFDKENEIGRGGYGVVFKGKLSINEENRMTAIKCLYPEKLHGIEEFKKELEMVSRFDHQNIIPFIGYCEKGNEMIMVYEYASNGSLDDHLYDIGKRSKLTWVQRLKICLGVARGLKYLHSGLGDHDRVIHRDIKSANILLDDNLEAKICDFGMSRLAPGNLSHTKLHTGVGGTHFYLDPLYQESSILTKASDVYSFGVVMFEMFSGRLAYFTWSVGDAKAQNLIPTVRENWYGGLDKIIDPYITDQISMPSLYTFKKIAYKCISLDLKKRPTMDTIIKKIEKSLALQENRYQGPHYDMDGKQKGHQETPLEEPREFKLEKIKLATNNFDKENLVGVGAHGMVCKGKLKISGTIHIVAVKRLLPELGKRKHEFFNEISILFSLRHQNIMSIIGYCDEDDEMIIVYEYAVKGCVADHLRDPQKRRALTWTQRLKICIGAARGLSYLYSGLEDNRTVIHQNFKSSGIFLDENMEAKISGFALSKSGLRNTPPTQVHKSIVGTTSHMSGTIKKKSDIYSFGVVLFEMLSGLLANGKRSIEGEIPKTLMHLVNKYKNVGLHKIIDPDMRDQINGHSFRTFKRVAYECISGRPTMDSIIENLQKALHFQENNEIGQQLDMEEDVNPQYNADEDVDPQDDTNEDFDPQHDTEEDNDPDTDKDIDPQDTDEDFDV